jgi:hypothetical protein
MSITDRRQWKARHRGRSRCRPASRR